jgi:hypothetical protein
VPSAATTTPTPTTLPGATLLFADDFNHGTLTGWTAYGGTWTNASGALEGQHTTTARDMRGEGGANVIYEGTVTLHSGRAAGLVFRGTDDGSEAYCLVLDARVDQLKLCRNHPFWFSRQEPLDVKYNQPYRLKVVVKGTQIDAYVDGQKWFTSFESSYATGKLGVLVHDGTARFDDLIAWQTP